MKVELTSRSVNYVVQDGSLSCLMTFSKPSGAPGFSHAVLIIQAGSLVARDWLANGSRINRKSIEFFIKKHREKLK